METISAENLEQYALENQAVILDLRPEADYRRGHVPGAVNVPQGISGRELERWKDRELLLYCARGALSMTIARDLERQGYRVKSVVGGYQAYQRKELW